MVEILAGAGGKHGRHERSDQGWDQQMRARHGVDPDAGGRGRHAVTATTDGEGLLVVAEPDYP